MKISLVTVCYNSADTIGDTLRSVRGQTYLNIEHNIIDGGSKDNTLKVVGLEGPHVVKIVSDKDGGIYDAMNSGILMATGDVVGFINSDDFYASETVVAKVASVFKNTNIDACYGDLCYVGQNDTSKIVRYWKSSSFRAASFQFGWCPPHPTFFVRREIYERFGGFDLSYKIAADFELMMRFLEVHKLRVIYIPEVLVKMRMGGTSNRSLSNVIKQNKEIIRALKSHGFRSSIMCLLVHKLISKGRQYFVRPTQG